MKFPRKYRLQLLVGLLACGALTGVIIWQHAWLGPKTNLPDSKPLVDLVQLPVPAGTSGLVRQELSEALGITGSASPQTRLDLLASIGGGLEPEECNAVLRALLEPRAVNSTEGWHAEYMHNLSLLLQGAEQSREDFARALATLARDAKRDETVRDYALQHLRQVWDRAGDGLRGSVEATFRELAGDPVLSAAALLSLHLLGTPVGSVMAESEGSPGLSERKPGFHIPDAELAPSVARILEEHPSANSIAPRLTALRIVGDRRMEVFHQDLRRIAAASEEEHVLVRMAAVANLARFGNPTDRVFLESLEKRDTRVAHAVRRAILSIR